MEALGLFADVASSAKAVEQLLKAGFNEAEITSLSSIPYPDGVLVKTRHRSWFHWVSLAGGIAGAICGFVLAVGTAWIYPVQTGDKPIISYYSSAVISYEFAMLFAIIGAVVGMFLEMGLPPWNRQRYDPAISEGYIGICVEVDSEQRQSEAEQVMQRAGAQRIVTEGSL